MDDGTGRPAFPVELEQLKTRILEMGGLAGEEVHRDGGW